MATHSVPSLLPCLWVGNQERPDAAFGCETILSPQRRGFSLHLRVREGSGFFFFFRDPTMLSCLWYSGLSSLWSPTVLLPHGLSVHRLTTPFQDGARGSRLKCGALWPLSESQDEQASVGPS